MADFDDQVFALPISGHYDCGYGYGPGQAQQRDNNHQQISVRSRNPVHGSPRSPSHLTTSRPRSPPTVLPNSYTTPHLLPRGQGSVESYSTTVEYAQLPSTDELNAPLVPPKLWTSTTSMPKSQNLDSDSENSTLSTRSRQASTPSIATLVSSVSSSTPDTSIEPDRLPCHSHPQLLSPSQSEAFVGSRPIPPIKLGRRNISDSHSGNTIFQLSDETRLKLSQQAIYQIYEAGTRTIVGTLGYSLNSPTEVAAILHGQDIVLKKEANSNRWCFKPSCLAKKSASWYWSKARKRPGVIILSDARKNGVVIAEIQRDVLSFEKSGLGLDTVNEICFAAIALAELARRSSDYESAPNLAAAIAVFALGEAPDAQDGDGNDHMSKPRRKLTLTL